MLNDPLSNALSKITNAENLGKQTVTISPVSKTIIKILNMMNEKGYLGDFKENTSIRGKEITLNLIGKVNKCGAVKPRFNIKKDDIEKFEKRYLPSSKFGMLFISTNKGIITNTELREEDIGGVLIAYCY